MLLKRAERQRRFPTLESLNGGGVVYRAEAIGSGKLTADWPNYRRK